MAFFMIQNSAIYITSVLTINVSLGTICVYFDYYYLFRLMINFFEQILATAKLCPDGLLFDSKNPNQEKCDYPFNVDCGNREYVRKFYS